jgi:hypothetical protein
MLKASSKKDVKPVVDWVDDVYMSKNMDNSSDWYLGKSATNSPKLRANKNPLLPSYERQKDRHNLSAIEPVTINYSNSNAIKTRSPMTSEESLGYSFVLDKLPAPLNSAPSSRASSFGDALVTTKKSSSVKLKT